MGKNERAQGISHVDLLKIYEDSFKRRGSLSDKKIKIIHEIGRAASDEGDQKALDFIANLGKKVGKLL